MAQQRTDGRGARIFVALVVVLSLAAALLSTTATPATAQSTGASGTGPTEATVTDEVTAAISEEGQAFVIANLNAPAGSPAAVGSVAQSVIDDLPEGSFEGQATAQPQPFVALKVDADGLAALSGNSDVSSVVLNHMNTVDLVNSVPSVGADVTRSLGIDGTGGVVAVLDTGVDRTHPFLSDTVGNSRVLAEACFSGAGDTYTNVYSLCPSGDTQETGTGAAAPCPILPACTHGTHVAGIAAGGQAANNGTSVPKYGVSPAASLIAAQVFSAYCSAVPLPNGTCVPGWQAVAFDSDIALAMVWVHDQTSLYGVDAVNLSVGGSTQSATACDSQTIVSAYVNLLRADGVATVIASGNDSAKNGISTPACISTAISVGSYDIGTNSVSSFSNSAANLTILAPGARTVGGTRFGIVSSLPGGTYGGKEGTSMATPHVAGAIAQIRQGRPSATVDQIVSLLTGNGTPVNDTNGVVKPLLRVDKSALEAPSLSSFGLNSLDTVGDSVGVTPILHGIPAPTTSFQWYRCSTASNGVVALPGDCVTIVGATTDHYTPVPADLGKFLTVRLTATNGVAPALVSNLSTGLIKNVPVMVGPPFVEAGNGSVHMIYGALALGGSPITGYVITLQPLGAPASPIVIDVGTVTNYTATGLTNGTTYSITVAGRNANGTGAPSPAAQATPFTIPDAPTAVAAAPGDGAATVTWSAPAFDGGAPAIARYDVTSSPGGKTCSWVIDVPPIGAPPTPQPLGCTVTGLDNNTAYTFTVRAQNMAGYGPDSAPSTPVTPVAGYHSLVPARLMDTRAGGDTIDHLYKATGAIAPGQTRDLPVLGRGGVPASGVAAVALNVTVVGSSSGGYLTVYPKGVSTPNASNLNFSAGQIIPNMVIVQVGTGGNVTFSNPFGNTPVIADVVGYFPSAAAYNPMVPARLMDTRPPPAGSTVDDVSEGEGSIPAGQTRDLAVVGRAGIPASGVGAVVLNITVAGSDSAGFLTAYPKGVAAPNASNLNFTAGQVIPNMAIVKVGTGGQITIKNPYGNTPVIVDVVGWFPTGTVYNPLVPARLMDTRAAGPGVATIDGQYVNTGMMGTGQTRTLKVTGRGGVPELGVGTVALNVTVTGPTGNGFLTVYPTGVSLPAASNLNYVTGQTIPNMVIAQVGPDGTISINDQFGATNVIVDVVGWFP